MTHRRSPRERLLIILLALFGLLAAACSGGDDSGSDDASEADGGFGDAVEGGDAPTYEPTGELIADTGFRPEVDGFSFPNYGASENENMTAAEVREMFGDDVCNDPSEDPCSLTPPAQAWLDQANGSMDGGHCYGFSVSALQMYRGDEEVDLLGGDVPVEIPLEGNADVQHQIAYAFAYQYLDAVTSSIIEAPPSGIVEFLTGALTPDVEETYTIGIYRADGGGGHAITPFAIEDNGDGLFHVLVYDNNFPDITRAIEVDTNAETWRYVAATNPDEPEAVYDGQGATNTIKLFPTTPGQGEQPCPFCRGEGEVTAQSLGAAPAAAQAEEEQHLVYLEGDPEDHGHLSLTTPEGLTTGYRDGVLVNEIPGAEVIRPFTQNYTDNPEPLYLVPLDVVFDIAIDGTGLTGPDTTTVGLIGPGYELAIEDFELNPGDVHALNLDPSTGELVFASNAEVSPVIGLGYEGLDASYGFAIQSSGLAVGDVIRVLLPAEGQPLVIDTSFTTTPGTYSIGMARYDEDSELEFENDGVELAPGESASLDYSGWVSEGTPITFTVTRADGTQEVEQLADE